MHHTPSFVLGVGWSRQRMAPSLLFPQRVRRRITRLDSWDSASVSALALDVIIRRACHIVSWSSSYKPLVHLHWHRVSPRMRNSLRTSSWSPTARFVCHYRWMTRSWLNKLEYSLRSFCKLSLQSRFLLSTLSTGPFPLSTRERESATVSNMGSLAYVFDKGGSYHTDRITARDHSVPR